MESKNKTKPRKLGALKGQKLIADGYHLDDCNDEIAEMFGFDTDEEKEQLTDRSCMTQSGIQRIGFAKDEKFFADGYDLDDFDDAVSEIFDSK